jgi:hypothetical protein
MIFSKIQLENPLLLRLKIARSRASGQVWDGIADLMWQQRTGRRT